MDRRIGHAVNANLADDRMPVNADIAEIGITGVAAAIANAIYHATDKLLA